MNTLSKCIQKTFCVQGFTTKNEICVIFFPVQWKKYIEILDA